MRKVGAFGVLLASLVLIGAGTRTSLAAGSATPPTVLSIKLTGVVDPFVASYVARGISHANGEGDAAVLITIDTPGGLDSSMRRIIKAILASHVPVICYTAPPGARAASAGTFIMMSCPVSAMAPETNIGAAHPVGVAGAIEQAKVTNDAAAFIRSLADRWGRNAGWAEQAVRNSVSVSAEDAIRLHVVDLVADNATVLLDDVGGCRDVPNPPTTGLLGQGGHAATCSARVVPFGMSLGESLFHALADPNVAFLLLNIGFLALIAWVFHPGFHASLAVGVVSVAVALAILETLPVELVGFVLLLVSAVLFVLDVKAKAHGVLTTTGIGTLILGGLLLFNPSVPSARVSRPLIAVVAVGAGLFAFFTLRALLAAKGKPVTTGREALEGATGVALSDLDPKGTVRARGETWSAESPSGPIPAGASVRIVQVRGVNLVVELDKELAEQNVPSRSGSEGGSE